MLILSPKEGQAIQIGPDIFVVVTRTGRRHRPRGNQRDHERSRPMSLQQAGLDVQPLLRRPALHELKLFLARQAIGFATNLTDQVPSHGHFERQHVLAAAVVSLYAQRPD